MYNIALSSEIPIFFVSRIGHSRLGLTRQMCSLGGMPTRRCARSEGCLERTGRGDKSTQFGALLNKARLVRQTDEDQATFDCLMANERAQDATRDVQCSPILHLTP